MKLLVGQKETPQGKATCGASLSAAWFATDPDRRQGGTIWCLCVRGVFESPLLARGGGRGLVEASVCTFDIEICSEKIPTCQNPRLLLQGRQDCLVVLAPFGPEPVRIVGPFQEFFCTATTQQVGHSKRRHLFVPAHPTISG